MLTTKRLKFKKVSYDDIDNVYKIFSNPQLTKYFISGSDKTKDNTKKRVDKIISHWTEYDFGDFILLNKVNKTLIGYGGLHYKERGGNINISYIIRPEFQKKGYGYETSIGLLQYGFNKLNLHKIVAEIDPDNKASQKLIEKCGFQFNNKIIWKGYERIEYVLYKLNFNTLA